LFDLVIFVYFLEKADAFVGRHRPYVTGRTPLETAYPAFS